MTGWPEKIPFVPATPAEVAMGQAARAAYYKSIDGWAHEHQWDMCAPDEREAWIDAARGVLREDSLSRCTAYVHPQGAPAVIDMNAAVKSNDP